MDSFRKRRDDADYGNAKDDTGFVDECKVLLETIVASLVDNKSALEIDVVSNGRITVFGVKCAREDVGKLIGKEGRTAGAMRLLLSHAAAKYDKRAMLEIIEPS